MEQRIGDWIETFTGRKFFPLDPRPEDICIEDIAHHLSQICRFTGAVREFYSVAQHSWLVSERVDARHALWGLLHDAAEAYLGDLSRPIKRDGGWAQNYREAERRVMDQVCEKFGLPPVEPESVRRADDFMVVNEARQLMRSKAKSWSWGHDVKALADCIEPWGPHYAELMFLNRFRQLANTGTGATKTRGPR